MNQKTRHIGKRKAGSSAKKHLRKLHTSEYENSCFIVLYFKEDTIDSKKLQSVVPSLKTRERTVQVAPSKKKSQEREREREREEERVRTGGKRRRKRKRKKRKGKKRRKKRRKWRERY